VRQVEPPGGCGQQSINFGATLDLLWSYNYANDRFLVDMSVCGSEGTEE
jgi:hypothetical protein